VHWQVAAASDLVIDGNGSTVNFSDFCLGLVLANVNRVTLRNFEFAWPNIQIASVASIVAVGGNGTTGYTYDVRISDLSAAQMPRMIAGITAWDRSSDHFDLALTTPSPVVTSFPPIACRVEATTSGLAFAAP
jgi:hypothetical protein